MSAIGKIVKGRCRGVRCDGCGKISMSRDGEYTTDGIHTKYINNKGRDCGHDLCEECHRSCAGDECGICGSRPNDPK